MRHAATNVGMLRQARAALGDEAASRPVARPEPQPERQSQPEPQPTAGRLAAVARRLAHRARTLAARTT
jgi:hypothetical protein